MTFRPPSSSSEIAENIKKGKDKIIQVYEMLPTYCVKEEIPEMLDGLRNVMKDYVLLETKYQDLKTSKQKVVQECMQKMTDPECGLTLDDINEMLKNTLTKEMEKHQEGYLERDHLYASMKNFVEDEEAGNSEDQEMNDGDDLAVTGVTVQTIDPYSKREFSDPLKNIICKHSYEKEIIISLINSNPRTKCYWMGCNNRQPIKVTDLLPDDELKRHMTRLKARVAI